MERLSKQVELQKNYDTSVVDDIETRLAKLKGEPRGSPTSSQPSGDKGASSMDLDDEEQVEQIISRVRHFLVIPISQILSSSSAGY